MSKIDPIPLFNLAPEIDSYEEEMLAGIRQVLRSHEFTLGSAVARFEGEFAAWLGVESAVAVNSGTDALLFALKAAGIGPGDEVILPAFTFVATLEAVIHAGAKPVFADIDPQTFTLDPNDVAAQINERTGAIIAVHLYGQGADLLPLRAVADRHGLKLIEDVAQACGAHAHERALGTWGEAAAFSFYPTKNLGALGDAGMMVTNDPAIAEYARKLRNHGQISRGDHRLVGYNSRMDGIQGAVLSQRLRHLNEWNVKRADIAHAYGARLADIEGLAPPVVRPGNSHVFQLYTVRVPAPRRQAIQDSLREAGVETGIYYPTPLYRLPPYQAFQRPLPVTEAAAMEVLSLPMWPSMSPDAIDRVCDAVRKACRP